MLCSFQVIFPGSLLNKSEVIVAVNEEGKKTAWKSYYENLLNTEFTWDRNSLSQVDPVNNAAILINKSIVRKAGR